jgi:hypothetical protein
MIGGNMLFAYLIVGALFLAAFVLTYILIREL